MKHFNSIVVQSTPPPINTIWLNDGILRYFDNGKWNTVGEQEKTEYILPTATTSRLGGVKKSSGIELLDSNAELTTVISKINEIITKLKSAGLIA